MANSEDPDQTAPIGAVCSGSTLFAPILNSSVMLGKYLQQTTSADVIFRCIFFLGALRGKTFENQLHTPSQASLVFFNPSCTPFTELLLLSCYYNNSFHAYIPW